MERLERAKIFYLEQNGWHLYAGAGEKCFAPPEKPDMMMTLDDAVVEQKRRDEIYNKKK